MNSTTSARFLPDSANLHKLPPTCVKVLEKLEELGYNVSCSKNCLSNKPYRRGSDPDWNASNNNRGVRIKLRRDANWSNGPYIDLNISIRNDIGNYRKLNEIRFYESSEKTCNAAANLQPLQNFRAFGGTTDFLKERYPNFHLIESHEQGFRFLEDLRGDEVTNQWRTKSDLPRPFPFKEAIGINENHFRVGNDNQVVCHKFFESVKMDSFVVIDKRLRLHTDGIEKPGADVWYKITGKTLDVNGGLCEASVLVNPEITGFYALHIRTFKDNQRYTITPNMAPRNGNIDFHQMSTIDKQMIEVAIEKYVSKL